MNFGWRAEQLVRQAPGMTGEEFEKLVVHLDGLLAEVVAEGPKHPEMVRAVPTWSFKPMGENARVIEQVVENVILWPSRNLNEWIASFRSYAAIEQALSETHVMRDIARKRMKGTGDFEGSLRSQVNIIIKDFVQSTLQRNTWFVAPEQRKSALEFWRALLVNGQTTHRLLMFTDGITVENALNLDGLVLRAPTYEESLAALKSCIETGDEAVLFSGAVIEGDERIAYGGTSVLGVLAGTLLTALRIWTKRPVTSTITYNAERSDIFGGCGIGIGSRSVFSVTKMSPLGKRGPVEDPSGFVEFWRRTRDIMMRPPNALGVALRRVDLMVEQERKTDRVLDLCIILEALFQLGNEQQELSYRLSLRTAHFLEGTKVDRQRTFDTVREGYSLRSKIAHGATASGSDATVQDKLEYLVFDAVKLYCERATAFATEDAHKAIVKVLDGYALERKTDI